MGKKKSVTESYGSLSVEELLVATFNSTESVRFIVNEEGIILYFNRKAYENGIQFHNRKLHKGDSLFEYANDTSNNVHITLKDALVRTFKGETFRVEAEVCFGDKSHWFETEYVPLFHKLKMVAASISIYDVTERKVHELLLNKLVNEIKQVQEERWQKTLAMVDLIDERVKMVLTNGSNLSSAAIAKNLKTLSGTIATLKNKVAAWQKT
ncbi:MAG: hypothetical protein K0S44_106 [Bacteroidetes bacterium]|jgi:hypothetical protein|nr:hypothetical protein [Bacteroidota bacterium]